MARHRFKRVHSNKNKTMIALVIMLLLCMGVGYAAITSSLSITGNTEIASNAWNIHFENASDTSTGTTDIVNHATISGTNSNMITYGIRLKNNADSYEFTADIVNSGSIPGKVSLSEMSGLSTEAAQYIDYTVTYANGNPVEVDDILNAGASKSIRVRVFYKDGVTLDENLSLSLYYNLEFVQSEEDYDPINPQIRQLINDNPTCITKYTGQVTDEVGETITASNVYFNKCADKRNIIFNNMCWQMIRTTETGGIKMIYNGEVVDNKCLNTRGDHKGIVGVGGSIQTLNAEYLYGDSFTYDITNSTFTLIDTTTATWSDSTYENLLGKFTCKNTEGTCTTLYNVNGYSNNTKAYTSSYTIGDTDYAQIGKSAFNANYRSPAMVGYMFNKVYNYAGNSAPTSESLMGNDVSYSNGIYTLLPADGESELGTTRDATHHYTCNSTSSTCSKVRYYYYNNDYIELDGAENIQAAINNMLYNDNVNRYNSSIKGIIDAWYKQNLLSKTNMLEDTVYCNARNMINQSTNGWNKDGSLSTYMYFKNKTSNNDLSCINVTDQFAISNNKAKLTYPVSLATHEELYTLTNNNSSTYYSNLTNTGDYWWGLSPYYFNSGFAFVLHVYSNGSVIYSSNVDSSFGVRLVVSLSTGAVISSGSGTESDPFIISE